MFTWKWLERIPKGGEIVQHDGYRMTIVNMDGRRIDKVKVEKMPGGTLAPAAITAAQGEKTVG